MLRLEDINKRLGLLEMSEVSLEIKNGEYFVLLGPSGVGKTVLLEIIAGLIRPDAGRIFWNQKDITLEPPEARGFALVYQDYALFPHMTVAQNIAYGLADKSDSTQERLRVLAEMLHVEQFLKHRPATLSGGQQQRVGLARALAAKPKLLLLDEPLSALDANVRLKLRTELKRLNRQLNIPFLHITHDHEEAMALGDRVAVMLEHRIQQIACPEELFRRPSNLEVASFLGMKNVLPVSAVNDSLCQTCGVQVHAGSAGNGVSHIWVMPEEILLSRQPFDSSARNQFLCKVLDWDNRNCLLAVRVVSGELHLTALITYASFKELKIEVGTQVYATFKSSAVHCF